MAVSDTINGVGLLIGGLAIPFLALIALGDGSFATGLATLVNTDPEYLAVLTKTNVDNKVVSVPWPTLLTGMMFYPDILLVHQSGDCAAGYGRQKPCGRPERRPLLPRQ